MSIHGRSVPSLSVWTAVHWIRLSLSSVAQPSIWNENMTKCVVHGADRFNVAARLTAEPDQFPTIHERTGTTTTLNIYQKCRYLTSSGPVSLARATIVTFSSHVATIPAALLCRIRVVLPLPESMSDAIQQRKFPVGGGISLL